MNKLSWKNVTGRLKAIEAPQSPSGDADFWLDFKARATLMRQDEPVAAHDRVPVALRWGSATALALVLIVAGWFMLPATLGAVTQIKALEVVAPYSGVIIMNDQSGRGTILWITGMESKHSSG
jgi:hypothetical protein